MFEELDLKIDDKVSTETHAGTAYCSNYCTKACSGHYQTVCNC